MKFTDFVIKTNEGKEDKILKSILNSKTLKELKKIRDFVWRADTSEKIKQNLKKALDAKMKEFTLKEERLHAKDKRAIIGFIESPKDVQYKMKNNDILKVKATGDNIKFSFDKDNHELAMTITDLVDAMGGYKMKPSAGNILVIPTEE